MSAPTGHRRTKIVATIGPATRTIEKLCELIDAGADIFRLNFSHGTAAEHAENVTMIREAGERCGKSVGILGDLPGPKLRLGELVDGKVRLVIGNEVTITTDPTPGTAERIPVGWEGLPNAVAIGGDIFLADGRLRLTVLSKNTTDVRCRVEVGGAVGSHQGLNLPGAEVTLPSAGDEDLEWVDFAIGHDIDLLAVSFVRCAEDLEPVEERLRAGGADIPLIAKIEKPEAAENAESIIQATTAGIMVARGDLGIEIPLEQVPSVQRRLIRLAGKHSKPSITATQMLASMVSSPRPTRAEVSDVANAIYQGTDAVMLSEETAIGEYAIEAVKAMDAVARATEPELPYSDWAHNRAAFNDDVAASVARAAVGATHTLGLTALVVPTASGRTARLLSAHRPKVPVLAVSPKPDTVRRLNLLFGVTTAVAEQWTGLSSLLENCARLAKESGVAESGDLIGILAGLPDQGLGTNLFEIHRVP